MHWRGIFWQNGKKNSTQPNCGKQKFCQSSRLQPIIEGFHLTTDLVVVVLKSSWRFSSVTLEREVIQGWCGSNWFQVKIKNLTSQPGKNCQTSLGQPDPKYLLDFLASAGFSCSCSFEQWLPESLRISFFFSVCHTEGFYWYGESFTSVANTDNPTQLAKTNFRDSATTRPCF